MDLAVSFAALRDSETESCRQLNFKNANKNKMRKNQGPPLQNTPLTEVDSIPVPVLQRCRADGAKNLKLGAAKADDCAAIIRGF